MNTFASYILTTLALPLLVFWPYAKELVVLKYSKAEDLYMGRGGQIGEFALWENEEDFNRKLSKVFLGYMSFFLIRVCKASNYV